MLWLRFYDNSTEAVVATKQRCLSCSVASLNTTVTLHLLCVSSYQVPKVPTCSSTTCPRSSETRTYYRCSCLSETWSLPKSSSTNRQTLASALVCHENGGLVNGEACFFFSSVTGFLCHGSGPRSSERSSCTKRWRVFQRK